MLTQRTAGRLATPALFALGAVCFSPATVSAKAKGSVVVQRVKTRTTDFGREVVIRTSKEPTFSVFRLSEPFRVLVDINDARMEKPIGLRKVRDGVLRYISSNQFSDEKSSILRVEIALEEEAPYSVRSDEDGIRVMIGSDQKKLDAAPRHRPVKAPRATPDATLSASEAAPVSLGRLRRRGAVLFAPVRKGQLTQGAVRVEELEHPSRLVIDVDRASVQPKYQRLNVNRLGVRRARVAPRGDGVRIVLDAKRGRRLPQVDISQERGRFRIAMSKPAPAPVPVAEAAPAPAEVKPKAEPKKIARAPAPQPKAEPRPKAVPQPKAAPQPQAEPQPKAEPRPKAEPEPVVAKVAPAREPKPAARPEAASAAPEPARIEDVTFEPKDGFVRLTLFMDENAAVKKETMPGSGAPVLRIPRARLPKALERTLDVTEVAGSIVTAISTYNDRGDVVISAAVGENTEHRHWTKGNRVMWDFRNTGETTVISYPEQATSGYAQATAVRTAADLAPKARRYKGRRISLDLKDADIQNVLRLLADVSKLNIVAADDVTGRVTIKLRNVPWDQALDIILRSKQLDKVRNGNIIRVAPIEVLRKEEELRLERQKARVELEPLAVRLIPVSYAVADEVKPQVTALLSPRGKVNIDERTNVLIVEDIAEVLLKVERLIRTLDTQTPQVLIEARIVEARANFARQLGIQWGGNVNATSQYGTSTGLTFPNNIRISGGADDQQNNVTEGVVENSNYAVNLPAVVGSGGGGALGFVFGSAGGAALINLRLSAAESTGKVKVISAPKVVTLDNKEAKILSGERVPITVVTANGPTTRFIDANLELNVTPHVTQDGAVLLKITATNNQLSNRVDLLGVPGIITREANTEMIVGDGDTAVLGGIYQRQTQENESYVPWLGKIPVLGWLFKTTNRTDARDELLIFISPRIINRSAALVNAG